MATLKHSETEQIVEGVDAETFLRDVSDPSFWQIIVEDAKAIEEKILDFIEPALQTVEGMFGTSIVSQPEVQAAQAADTEALQAAVNEVQQ